MLFKDPGNGFEIALHRLHLNNANWNFPLENQIFKLVSVSLTEKSEAIVLNEYLLLHSLRLIRGRCWVD